jgi:dipeptidyl-peptidase-3
MLKRLFGCTSPGVGDGAPATSPEMRHAARFSRQQGRFRVSPALAVSLFLLTGVSLFVMSRYSDRLQPVASTIAKVESMASPRRYLVGQAGPFALVQVYADGFEKLSPRERLLAYHLAEAGIAGDPIYYDQIADYGLELKQLLEGIVTHPNGIDPGVMEKIRNYTQLVWIQHGNYNLDSSRKFLPEFTAAELQAAAERALNNGASFGPDGPRDLKTILERLSRPIFDADYKPMMTVKAPPAGQDKLTASGNNLHEGVTSVEAAKFAAKYTLNSRLIKRNGRLVEEIYRAGTPDGKVPPGRYANFLNRSIAHLEMAAQVADPAQAEVIRKLIRYYQTGEKDDWYAYNIAWVALAANVDFIQGFVEVYLDPLGGKGAYESVVSFVDAEQTHLMRSFADNAEYFESRAPWLDAYKKQGVKPPVANVITVVSETGESGPISPTGINLPNEQDIRQQHGTKSVLLFNVSNAFTEAVGPKAIEEFSATPEEIERGKRYGVESRKLVVMMHEVLGHGSGKVSPQLRADPHTYLKEYYSTLEEARADLVALWNYADAKLDSLGIAHREELLKAAYDAEARGALTLLYRYPHGDQVEEDHDRGNQMIVQYLMQNFHCIEQVTQNGKVYLRVTDYARMHEGVGKLLAELMRIKAEGDYAAIGNLINTYGVKLNTEWRDQVQQRASRIGLPTRGAFISPVIDPVRDAQGQLVDAKIRYTQNLADVMLEYSRKSLEGWVRE